MCGIFGAIGSCVPKPAIERVLQALHHRGPDGSGLFVDEAAQVTLAHTRLAVIDLVTGAQPLESRDGNIVLIANGEIYDFERIRSSLESKGHVFRTRSDSEVIIGLYEEYGLDCFQHLRGEFAFLLYDKAKKLFIAARDRFGIKPLYLAPLGTSFVFASEMKAIFASGLVEPKLNVAGLDPLLDHSPDEVRFPFEGIGHVPPASYVRIDLNSCEASTTRYWSPDIPDETAQPVPVRPEDEEKAAQSILRELEEAVRLRLRSDVPVGLYLSGGVDSSFIGALMARNLSGKLHSFSISFEGSERNERAFAERAAQVVGTIHHELNVTKQMLWDHLEQAVWFSELPFATLAPVGKFLLSQEARKYVTVVLTGEGADEVFLGYRNYFKRAILETRSGASRTKASSAQTRRLKLGGLPQGLVNRISLLLFHKSQRERLSSARAGAASREPGSKPLINAVQESRIAGMPLDILCFLGDREEMAHSLEARLPFLDHELFDVAKFIPVDLKMRAGLEKAVLRDAARKVLPDDLAMRRKLGFMLTSEKIDLFGRDRQLAGRLHEYLSRDAFQRAHVFSYRAYRFLTLLARLPSWLRLRSLQRLRRDVNKVIMYIMQVHMLHRMFVEEPRWGSAA
jgi:asparagine synthase (glutamine-hydrolysing)